jgi:16S rRNA (cytosine967-C5)-methyltransferase
MPDSDLANAIRLAHRALVLVTKGVGERTAVRRVAVAGPHSARVRRRSLDLVVGTVREQDLLDKIVQSVIKDEKLRGGVAQTFRLAAHLNGVLGSNEFSDQAKRALRGITPPEYLSSLELLLGSLPAIQWVDFSRGQSDLEQVALRTHHPVWWVDYCFNLLGRSEAIEFLSAPPRPRYLRVNPLKNGGRISIPTKATQVSRDLKSVPSQKGVYEVKSSLARLSEFFELGVFQIQDLASFFAVKAASPKPGEKVLDLCAAPGAKTATLAQMMKNRGRIISVDYSQSRMRTWSREIARLGVKIAEPLVCDAGALAVLKTFDLVLIDPPCSGTGIFDRNPGMKWHLLPEALKSYASLQRRFLDAAAPLLEANGRILYCTCSVTLEENEDVISAFVKLHPEFETRPVLKEHGSPGLRGMSDCRRLYPHRDGAAGYFVSLLQRSS